MKESYGEGLANHTSLESCGNYSNVVAEALTEGSTGGLLSSENTYFRVPTLSGGREGNTYTFAMRECVRPGGVDKLGMRGRFIYGNREISENFLCIHMVENGLYLRHSLETESNRLQDT